MPRAERFALAPEVADQQRKGGLASGGILVAYRHGQGLAGSDQNGQPLAAGQAGIDKVANEHAKVLAELWNDHRVEFRSLRLVDGDGIGQVEFGQLIAAVCHHPLVGNKADLAGERRVVDPADPADVAIEDVEFIVVAAVDHPVPDTEDSLADR